MNLKPFQEQYAAVLNGAGFAPLEGWESVRVTGADRVTFLHNMCTNDVKSLPVGGSCEAFFTDVKGKIVAHAFLLAGDESIDLLMSPGQAEQLIAHLDRYIIREDVRLADRTMLLSWGLVWGMRANQLVGGLSEHCRSFKCDAIWCGGHFIRAEVHDPAALCGQLTTLGGVKACPDIWHAIRVESAWPLYGVDFDNSNLPQEVNRDAKAIHFRKGCYLGQETIARIDALGHVNRKLVQLRFDGEDPPAAGSVASQGEQIVGRITSSCWLPRLSAAVALAMIRRGANDIGAQVCVGESTGEVVNGESV